MFQNQEHSLGSVSLRCIKCLFSNDCMIVLNNEACFLCALCTVRLTQFSSGEGYLYKKRVICKTGFLHVSVFLDYFLLNRCQNIGGIGHWGHRAKMTLLDDFVERKLKFSAFTQPCRGVSCGEVLSPCWTPCTANTCIVVVPTVPQGKRGVRWNPFGFCPPGCPVCCIPICASAVKSDIKSHMTRLLCFLRNWYVDEPSCGSEICVVMYHQPSAPPGVGGPYMFQWNDDRCNMKNNFICKYALGNESFCSFKNQPAPSPQDDVWDGSNR